MHNETLSVAADHKAFFWVTPLADFPESLATRAGKMLIAPVDCA